MKAGYKNGSKGHTLRAHLSTNKSQCN